MNIRIPSSPSEWWRTLCWVTDQIIVTGDLNPKPEHAVRQLSEWAAVGVTHIVDVRQEWSDAALVAEHQPQITYLHCPTHDNGSAQDDNWFTSGVNAIVEAINADNDNTVVIHCHMGVNRAPSLAFAALLELGWTPVEALRLIRRARPIAAVLYAEQAVDWFCRKHSITDCDREELCENVGQWLAENPVDVRWVISRIRLAENESASNIEKSGTRTGITRPLHQPSVLNLDTEVL